MTRRCQRVLFDRGCAGTHRHFVFGVLSTFAHENNRLQRAPSCRKVTPVGTSRRPVVPSIRISWLPFARVRMRRSVADRAGLGAGRHQRPPAISATGAGSGSSISSFAGTGRAWASARRRTPARCRASRARRCRGRGARGSGGCRADRILEVFETSRRRREHYKSNAMRVAFDP